MTGTDFGHALEDALGAVTSGRAVSVDLTEEGARIAERLGAVWFQRTVAAVALAYPEHRLELVLTASAVEPIHEPDPLTEPDDVPGVGRITVDGGANAPGIIARTLRLPGEAILDGTATFQFLAAGNPLRRAVGAVYGALYHRIPVLLDEWRQRRNTLGWRLTRDKLPKPLGFAEFPRPDAAADTTAPVALFALHWLEPGGAESWALESAEVAAKAGFRVVLTVDVAAAQRLLDRALAITPDVYLAANTLAEDDWGPFLVHLLDTFQPGVVFVHHSGRVYAALPEVRERYPEITVIDSTHIHEFRTGGFVATSIQYTEHIDVHHVISPQLRELYGRDAAVDPAKVVYHPLTHPGNAPTTQRRVPEAPLRLGFLGRLTSQKRPLLFVELAARLEKQYPGEFEFVMQGDGVLEPRVVQRLDDTGMTGKVVRRAWGPIDDFMASIDVLVISSENEGLTLTTLEAEEHGVLVLSADVGSQRDVIAPMLLVPRYPTRFLRASADRLHTIAGSSAAFAAARAQQTEKITALNRTESASAYFATLFSELKEKH